MKHYNSKKLALMLVNSIHGSGIDGDYYINQNSQNIIISNYYHCMDDAGYYDGCITFNVIIDKKTAKVKRITFPEVTSYHYRKYVCAGIRGYLEQLFFDPDFRPYDKRPYYLRIAEYFGW
jgi:hypothetical protein